MLPGTNGLRWQELFASPSRAVCFQSLRAVISIFLVFVLHFYLFFCAKKEM